MPTKGSSLALLFLLLASVAGERIQAARATEQMLYDREFELIVNGQ